MKGVWLSMCVLAVSATLLMGLEDGSGCLSHSTCGACIISPQCQWCSSRVMGKSKCVHVNETKAENWCDGTPLKVVTKTKDIHPGTDSSWILPERVKVVLRVREEYKLNITYRRLNDYPVDLYFLMDLSASMETHKDNLSRLGNQLATVMKNITENFRLGFGSFVDKVAMPYVDTHPSKIDKPCPKCVRPYSFKNHLPLTDNTDIFANKVGEVPMSGNVDHPEGGFDALMQTMVCTKEIGWRNHARHLLVMATDASFHIAGDGKLGGVVEPNDENCHMKDDEYTHGLIYDYPSISQINRQAYNKSISLIFAVTKDREKLYKTLVQNIQGSNWGQLSNHSSGVIGLVLDVYEKLVDSVEMTDDSGIKDVRVKYKSLCKQNSGEFLETKTCHNIHARENVTFEVTVSVLKCPQHVGEIWKETITVSPNGIKEKMMIDLEVHCGCACEQEGNLEFEKNSSSCNNHGDKKCGMCDCNEDYTGHMCQCSRDQYIKKESTDACFSNSSGVMCSNRGSCVCNICVCNQRQDPKEKIYGPFCECDNFSCLRSHNKICNGQGQCDCGTCICNSGWTKEDCSCQESLDSCRALGDVKLCSGAGKCQCGGCSCNKGHTGQFCEDCMSCPGGRCKNVAKCVEYLAHKTIEYDATFCDPKNITLVKKVEQIDEKNRVGQEKFCREPDASGCSFVFTYEEFDTGFIIIAEEEKQCPTPVDLLGIVFGVIGGTVLLGLISIFIWKLLTSIHDKREFAKFEKDRTQTKWGTGVNPTFVQATSTFSNPTFGSD